MACPVCGTEFRTGFGKIYCSSKCRGRARRKKIRDRRWERFKNENWLFKKKNNHGEISTPQREVDREISFPCRGPMGCWLYALKAEYRKDTETKKLTKGR